MEFDHVHFYVEDAGKSRDWFVSQLGFQAVSSHANNHTRTEVICSGNVYFLLSSPLTAVSFVANWLKRHSPGVGDVAFRVRDIEVAIAKATLAGAKILEPIHKFRLADREWKAAKIAGWGDLSHTLIEGIDIKSRLFATSHNQESLSPRKQLPNLLSCIDHIVLNVEKGDLEAALTWYEKVLGFQLQQKFEIQTERSGLRSRVMVHANGGVKFPINEPTSLNSQIQEFLNVNKGSGIQHIALQTENIVQAVGELRSRGLIFLSVPASYYEQVQQRWGNYLCASEWKIVKDHQILVDNQGDISEGMLLQIFTEPIFAQPTFFFELIERRVGSIDGKERQAQGFGEGNFLALFEAIEREQMKRGTLGREV